ncbi:MAG: DUF2141 domain-containing protein [Pseudomonadales bacterium]
MQTVSLLLLMAFCTTAVAGTGQLTIRLVGFTSDEGSAAYAMWSGPERWLGDGGTVTDGYASIEEGVSRIVIDDLPFGEYAVSAYHDRNSNEKLDTGLFRIPKEPLGTSNDAKIRFGPPRYTDAKFLFNEAAMTIIIPIRKLF